MGIMNRWRMPRVKAAQRALASLIAVVFVATALVAVQAATPAQALDGSEFNPGYIIGDSDFYNANAMSQSEIQSFLERRLPEACGNSLCLKTYRENTRTRPRLVSDSTGLVRCEAYAGAQNETAAAIIFKAQQACGISARVILVTLQKEQGLLTKPAPTDAAMKRAMGQACPDTAPCAPASLGFGNQVYLGTLQLSTYRASRFSIQPGVRTIQWHPNAACGSSTFAIQNYATAALYAYTPYRPNAASLGNLGGSGDACSSYGNRNFWVYYSTWFGGPTGNPTGQLEAVATGASNRVRISGWAIDPDSGGGPINVRVRGAGWSTLVAASAQSSSSTGAFPGVGDRHGFSAEVHALVGYQTVCVDAVNFGRGADSSLGCRDVNVTSPMKVTDRIAGPDRYSTAVAVSARAFAPGVAAAYITSGTDFPDALSSTPVAGSQGAPVLLSSPAGVSQSVIDELKRLRPKKIVVIGGTQAVPPTVEAQVGAIAPVQRLGGADRYETSLNTADVLGSARSGRAYVVSGRSFPDALSAASAAGFQDAPMILVDGGKPVEPALASALQRWGVTSVTVVGGATVMSAQLVASIRGVPGVKNVAQIGGADRFETSVAINAAVYPRTNAAALASGLDFADGLVGGAVAGRDQVPLYVSRSTCVPVGVIDRMLSAGTASVRLFGGPQALTWGVQGFAPC